MNCMLRKHKHGLNWVTHFNHCTGSYTLHVWHVLPKLLMSSVLKRIDLWINVVFCYDRKKKKKKKGQTARLRYIFWLHASPISLHRLEQEVTEFILKLNSINACYDVCNYTNGILTSLSVLYAIEFLNVGWCQDHRVKEVLEFHLNTSKRETFGHLKT